MEISPNRAKLEQMVADFRPRFDNVAVGADRAATQIRVEGKGRFASGDLLLATRTNEIVCVERATAKMVRVRRGVGSSAHPLEKGDELLRLSPA
jgi:hypothetical protein